MPKELTHWWLAAEAMQRLPAGHPTRCLLEQNRAAYLVGAVLPDTLLHLLHGPYCAVAQRLADRFHDTQQHSFSPLIACSTAQPDATPAFTACLLGVASHMLADIVVHPFVYSQAGNDIGRHYQVETDLDMWLLNAGQRPPALRLSELLNDQVRTVASTALTRLFDPNHELPPAAAAQALTAHCRFQAMYSNLFWQLTAAVLGALPGTPIRAWQRLFYPVGWRSGRPIHWPARWIVPATGQERTDDPEHLLRTVVERTAGLFVKVAEVGLSEALRREAGENLLTGQAPTRTNPVEGVAVAQQEYSVGGG